MFRNTNEGRPKCNRHDLKLIHQPRETPIYYLKADEGNSVLITDEIK